MRVAIPHHLGRAEAIRRLHERAPEMGHMVPGGLAEVSTQWPSEDRMVMSLRAMGQELSGHVDIEEGQVVFTVILPPALSFFEGAIARGIETQGKKLLT
jgi:hypothetical protein